MASGTYCLGQVTSWGGAGRPSRSMVANTAAQRLVDQVVLVQVVGVDGSLVQVLGVDDGEALLHDALEQRRAHGLGLEGETPVLGEDGVLADAVGVSCHGWVVPDDFQLVAVRCCLGVADRPAVAEHALDDQALGGVAERHPVVAGGVSRVALCIAEAQVRLPARTVAGSGHPDRSWRDWFGHGFCWLMVATKRDRDWLSWMLW